MRAFAANITGHGNDFYGAFPAESPTYAPRNPGVNRESVCRPVGTSRPPLQFLINDAAGGKSGGPKTADGFQQNFEIDYLAPFLLTELLLPSLRRSARDGMRAVVVNVASDVHLHACELAGWCEGYDCPCFNSSAHIPFQVRKFSIEGRREKGEEGRRREKKGEEGRRREKKGEEGRRERLRLRGCAPCHGVMAAADTHHHRRSILRTILQCTTCTMLTGRRSQTKVSCVHRCCRSFAAASKAAALTLVCVC
eukprot:SAG31_NODE_325_length_17671_cov_9.902743_7_plen_252_part_00